MRITKTEAIGYTALTVLTLSVITATALGALGHFNMHPFDQKFGPIGSNALFYGGGAALIVELAALATYRCCRNKKTKESPTESVFTGSIPTDEAAVRKPNDVAAASTEENFDEWLETHQIMANTDIDSLAPVPTRQTMQSLQSISIEMGGQTVHVSVAPRVTLDEPWNIDYLMPNGLRGRVIIAPDAPLLQAVATNRRYILSCLADAREAQRQRIKTLKERIDERRSPYPARAKTAQGVTEVSSWTPYRSLRLDRSDEEAGFEARRKAFIRAGVRHIPSFDVEDKK